MGNMGSSTLGRNTKRLERFFENWLPPYFHSRVLLILPKRYQILTFLSTFQFFPLKFLNPVDLSHWKCVITAPASFEGVNQRTLWSSWLITCMDSERARREHRENETVPAGAFHSAEVKISQTKARSDHVRETWYSRGTSDRMLRALTDEGRREAGRFSQGGGGAWRTCCFQPKLNFQVIDNNAHNYSPCFWFGQIYIFSGKTVAITWSDIVLIRIGSM